MIDDPSWRPVEISNAGKVLFPDDGITEGDLADYYNRVWPWIMPHLEDRPLSMQRFPEGIGRPGFYEKEAPAYFPPFVLRTEIEVQETSERRMQVVCNSRETLVYLADQACITPHTWLSRVGHLDGPDKLIFDLDPPEDDFDLVRTAAHDLHALLQEIGLLSFPMLTGSRGLHVVIPLNGDSDFDTAREFARSLADRLAAHEPKQLTTETRKNKRDGRLFIDYLRNAYAQTSVPAYAVRARPGAPVATPVSWDELDEPDLTSSRYTLRTIFERLDRLADPWADFYRNHYSLREAAERLAALPE